MQTVQDRIIVHGPPELIFDLAQDYNLRLEWDPFLRAMRFLDGANEAAVGVRVWVKAWTGLTMTVEYITLERPRVVAMKMLSGPFFFRHFSGSWRFLPHSTGSTEVIFKYAYEIRWTWSQWLLNPVINWMFRRDIAARLRGLKRGAEEQGLLARLGSSGGNGAS
jgi:ribosome-associated toxin RatA of RatAB toxin-antitoxin module